MFIDLHCHPAMKPLGKSFLKESTRFVNSPNRKQKIVSGLGTNLKI